MNMEPIKNVPDLSERAYYSIKEAIVTFKVRPGEILTTGGLAEQLNISRTPVREALLRLQLDGLVTLLPQKGAEVNNITADDIREIYELRIILESYATEVAVTKLTDADLSNLESIMQTAEDAFQRGERKFASDTARELHNILIAKVNNQRMRKLLDELDDHYKRIRLVSTLIPGRLEKSFEQHKVIVAALKARDSAGSEKAMADHLISVRDETLAALDHWAILLDGIKNQA
jgi:DNA-binding GntR family transcriptional regulator